MTETQSVQPTGYTASGLAEIAGISRIYVAWLCRNGKLACERVGGVWFIRYDVAQTWLSEREAKQAKES